MTITIETLKENRTQIIERITNEFGESAVKEIMTLMSKTISDVEDMFYSDLNEYIDQMFDMASFSINSKPDSKMVTMFNDAHIDEKFNDITGDWEKY